MCVSVSKSLDLIQAHHNVPISFHPSFFQVHERIQKALKRFPLAIDSSILNDLYLFYLLATREYLEHRTPSHLFRLVLSIHFMQKKLLRAEVFSSNQRDLKIRWIPTHLIFPFTSKPVLGCLIGFNILNRYELFDEENILLALQKHLPELRLVRESKYCHNSKFRSLRIFYLEIEKQDSLPLSGAEQTLLKTSLEEKLINSIQTLSPSIFIRLNEEEVFKQILVLSQEIQSTHDLPQAYITFDRQTGTEIIFRVSLVFMSPFHRFSLKERFFDCTFISERLTPVKFLDGHSVQAHIFRLSFPRTLDLLRTDGSLDFYAARKKVVSLIFGAIGEFRDYNGGILIKQQELLDTLKHSFPEVLKLDPESMEHFFYAIMPLEKQVLLPPEVLSTLFKYFLQYSKEPAPKNDIPYSFKIYRHDRQIFFLIRAEKEILNELITEVIQNDEFDELDATYNVVKMPGGTYLNGVLLQPKAQDPERLLQAIQNYLEQWHQRLKQQQILRIALEHSVLSLDPRIGGEAASGDILRFLFEGLTRFSKDGIIENGVAESIECSSNLKQYIFKLRPTFWNDGSPLSAYDFEYSWKKILSPDFKTPFADHFYHIKNAKEAKEGLVPLDDVGIQVIDDRTLKVELVMPTSHFLQWTAHPLFSPVHRLVDQQFPQWPYQSGRYYPCNGPFQLKMNQPNQGYQLIKNPYYWEANKIKLDQVILTNMNPLQAIHAFQKKQIDWVGNPFGYWHPSYNILSSKENKLLRFSNTWLLCNAINVNVPPFNNPKIRQALCYAIKRSEIIEHADMPLSPAHSFCLPHYRDKNTYLFPDYNRSLAAQLFREGLEELNMKVEEIAPISLIFLEVGIHGHIANFLKRQFEDCFKISVMLEPMTWSTAFNRLSKGQFQMGFFGWTSWVDDPIYPMKMYKAKSNEINFSKWEHPEFQRLIELSEQEIAPFQRSKYLIEAEKILSQEVPVIPLFFQPAQAIVNEKLQVMYRNPSGPFNPGRSYYN
ncbi:MAG: peptide ABC transporter substrate-binding protein [Parachlamydiales bacterium]|nr:peptide ABC transporter substrate-binding protein [Parachlamydiales bacterium]